MGRKLQGLNFKRLTTEGAEDAEVKGKSNADKHRNNTELIIENVKNIRA